MNGEEVRRAVREITPVDAREADSIERTLAILEAPGDPFDQRENAHHVTASAFVVSSRGVLLHRHRRLGIWVQPGGHVDPGETVDVATLREVREETGLDVRHLDPVELFHVDVHPGPRGHTHYDLRFVVLSEPLDPTPPPGESPLVEWFDFAEAPGRAVADLSAALVKLGTWVNRTSVA